MYWGTSRISITKILCMIIHCGVNRLALAMMYIAFGHDFHAMIINNCNTIIVVQFIALMDNITLAFASVVCSAQPACMR